MIVVVAHYRALPGRADEVAAELGPYAVTVRTEPGCITFDVSRDLDDDHHFVLYEVYRDRGSLDVHIATPHFTDVAVERIRPMLADRSVSLLTPLD